MGKTGQWGDVFNLHLKLVGGLAELRAIVRSLRGGGTRYVVVADAYLLNIRDSDAMLAAIAEELGEMGKDAPALLVSSTHLVPWPGARGFRPRWAGRRQRACAPPSPDH